MFNGLVRLNAEALQHLLHAAAENAHEIVFERQKEFGCARVALTARTTAELVVDAAAFMAFGRKNVKTASLKRAPLLIGDLGFDFLALAGDCFFSVAFFKRFKNVFVDRAAKLNVGPASGHVGCDRHGARNACIGDNIGFLFVETRIQNAMGNRLFLAGD